MREKILLVFCTLFCYSSTIEEADENQQRSNLMTFKHILQHNTPQLLSQINSMLQETPTLNHQPPSPIFRSAPTASSNAFVLSDQPIPGDMNFGPMTRHQDGTFYNTNSAESQLLLIRSLLSNLLKLIDSMLHEQPTQRFGPTDAYSSGNRLQHASSQGWSGQQPQFMAPKPPMPEFGFQQPPMSENFGFFGQNDSPPPRYPPPQASAISQNDQQIMQQPQQQVSLSSAGLPGLWPQASNSAPTQNSWQRANLQQQPQQSQIRSMAPPPLLQPQQQQLPDFLMSGERPKFNAFSNPSDVMASKDGFSSEFSTSINNNKPTFDSNPNQPAVNMRILDNLGLLRLPSNEKNQQQGSSFQRSSGSGRGEGSSQQGTGMTGGGQTRSGGGQQNSLMGALG